VNQHLGEAEEFLIYGVDDAGTPVLKEKRKAPLPGGGNSRWMKVAEILHDCKSLLVGDVGSKPENIIASSGIQMMRMEGMIDDIVPLIFQDENVDPYLKKNRFSCGSGCTGNGMGCG
jgi:nitrogen fixation protein NifB